MGFFSDAIKDVKEGIGDVTDTLGLTSGGQEEAIEKGLEAQVAASEAAIEEQRLARTEAREILDPFVDIGLRQKERGFKFKDIKQPVKRTGLARLAGIGAPKSQSGLAQGVALGTSGLALRQANLGEAAGQQLLGGVSDIQGLDPNVLQSPFFQALQEEGTRNIEQSAAARGRVGAGGTADAIARQSLLLGQQFGQQDLQNRLTAQGQRFGQLSGALGFGLGAGQQGFQNRTVAAQQGFQNITGARQQNFANLTGLNAQQFAQLSQADQANLANQLAVREQDFGQRFSLLGLGQSSAAGQAAGAQQFGRDVGGLLTGIGNAQAAGQIGIANLQGQAGRNLLGILGSAGGGAIAGASGALGPDVGAVGGAGLGIALSDRRFKENIKRVGHTDDGLPIYTYNYKGGNVVQMGVMAQELERVNPNAVVELDGVKYVNYGGL